MANKRKVKLNRKSMKPKPNDEKPVTTREARQSQSEIIENRYTNHFANSNQRAKRKKRRQQIDRSKASVCDQTLEFYSV